MLNPRRQGTKKTLGIGLCVILTCSIPSLALGGEPAESQQDFDRWFDRWENKCILSLPSAQPITIPQDIPHRRYLKAMCDMLLEIQLDLLEYGAGLEAEKQVLDQKMEAEGTTANEQLLAHRFNAIERKINRLTIEHYERLGELIEQVLTTNRRSEEAFWANWKDEKKQYWKTVTPLNEQSVELSGQLGAEYLKDSHEPSRKD